MKRSFYLPFAFSVLVLGLSSAALANPRNAASKIMGDFTPFDSPNQVSRRTTYRYVTPVPVEQPRAATAQTPPARRFSYEPKQSATTPPTQRQPAAKPQAPTTRRFSYEPETWTESPVYRPRPTVQRPGFSPVRNAASKILGEY